MTTPQHPGDRPKRPIFTVPEPNSIKNIYKDQFIADFNLTELLDQFEERVGDTLDAKYLGFSIEDGFSFVELKSIGCKLKIAIPYKQTKCSNKWSKLGERKKSIRISSSGLNLLYEVKPVKNKSKGVVAVDQGAVDCCSLSDGQLTGECNHGHGLRSIMKKLGRCKKGSKGFQRAQKHRTNYINWSINNLDFSDIKTLRIEKLQNVRYGKQSSRFLSHWTYTEINNKLKQEAELNGIEIVEVPNKFRSQRCSCCGYVHKKNRNSKKFKCLSCGFSRDSDSNAASNLMLDLFEIPFYVFKSQINRTTGFYWLEDRVEICEEPIVPHIPNKLSVDLST